MGRCRVAREGLPGLRLVASTGLGEGDDPAVALARRVRRAAQVAEVCGRGRARWEGRQGAVLLAWALRRETRADSAWDAAVDALGQARAGGLAGVAAKLDTALAVAGPVERRELGWMLVAGAADDLRRIGVWEMGVGVGLRG